MLDERRDRCCDKKEGTRMDFRPLGNVRMTYTSLDIRLTMESGDSTTEHWTAGCAGRTGEATCG